MQIRPRIRRHLSALAIALFSWIVAMVFVRLSLDWSDAQPYQGEATELRSLVIALTALAIGFGGTLFAAVRWWKSRDRSGRLRR